MGRLSEKDLNNMQEDRECRDWEYQPDADEYVEKHWGPRISSDPESEYED